MGETQARGNVGTHLISGTQARRHAGTQARRHAGTQARRLTFASDMSANLVWMPKRGKETLNWLYVPPYNVLAATMLSPCAIMVSWFHRFHVSVRGSHVVLMSFINVKKVAVFQCTRAMIQVYRHDPFNAGRKCRTR